MLLVNGDLLILHSKAETPPDLEDKVITMYSFSISYYPGVQSLQLYSATAMFSS